MFRFVKCTFTVIPPVSFPNQRRFHDGLKTIVGGGFAERVAQYGSSDSGSSLGDIFQAVMKNKEEDK